MIKLIQSKKFTLPIVYLVEDNNDLQQLPPGIPFIKGNYKDYRKCVQMLEWEVLWKSAIQSGLKFNWAKILKDNGYKTWNYGIAYSDEGDLYKEGDISKDYKTGEHKPTTISCEDFLNDCSYYVDIEVLKNLKLIPKWYEDIESAVKTNVMETVVFNPYLYTKKLGISLGDFEYNSMQKNLIVIDISNSIPRSVSNTCLILCKTLAEKFYADVIITGLKSTLYEYGTLENYSVEDLFKENGGGNEQVYFRKIVEEHRSYKTAIVFGDNHQPGYKWECNSINISEKQGKELCNFKVKEIISFHTTSPNIIAGYARWFDVPNQNITHIKNWVKDLNF